jgi:regulator of replication initiation timing
MFTTLLLLCLIIGIIVLLKPIFDRLDTIERKILDMEEHIMSMNDKLVSMINQGNKIADILNNHLAIVEKKHTSTKPEKKTNSKTKTKKRDE